MNRCMIACSMIEDEINKALKEENCDIDVVMMDRGLHAEPEKLLKTLQQEIDAHQEYDEILLCYGLCGNGTAGLKSEKATLIIPKFDDCINMMLCTGKRRSRELVKKGIIYATAGWTQDDEGPFQQFKHFKEIYDYDDETIADLMDMMYGNYSHLALLDTGCFDKEAVREHFERTAEFLGLELIEVPGTNRIIRQLIKGEYDDNFIILPPGKSLGYNDFASFEALGIN